MSEIFWLRPAHPLWGQAFRPMFLFSSAFSVVAMALWGLYLSGLLNLSLVVNPLFWHSHEMIFGFVAAVLTGFLLTAVQNWTGQRATNGWPLMLLTLLWLSGRLLMLTAAIFPWWLVAVVDLLFLPCTGYFLWRLLYSVRQSRNYFFVPLLLLLTLCNALMHWASAHQLAAWMQWGSHTASWIIILFIAVVGGRVMPMFTANGTMTPKAEAVPWLEKAALGSLWLCALLFLLRADIWLPGYLLAVLLCLTALLNGMRCFRWRIWVTWKVPLLWSLHLAYWCMPAGLLALAAHFAGLNIAFSTALHWLTAGATGGMILAMIARISLGHSGRPLQPHPWMSVAFASLLLAVLVRTLLVSLFPAATMLWLVLAAAGWCWAFMLFFLLYRSVLTTPRPDGRPG